MIVDTSALLAILFDEPDAERYARALADADTVRLSAGSFVEALTSATASPTPSRGQPPSRCSSRGEDFNKTDIPPTRPSPQKSSQQPRRK
jgi:uncharacterized protein with PIN domain